MKPALMAALLLMASVAEAKKDLPRFSSSTAKQTQQALKGKAPATPAVVVNETTATTAPPAIATTSTTGSTGATTPVPTQSSVCGQAANSLSTTTGQKSALCAVNPSSPSPAACFRHIFGNANLGTAGFDADDIISVCKAASVANANGDCLDHVVSSRNATLEKELQMQLCTGPFTDGVKRGQCYTLNPCVASAATSNLQACKQERVAHCSHSAAPRLAAGSFVAMLVVAAATLGLVR
jgi:hypothetical protein